MKFKFKLKMQCKLGYLTFLKQTTRADLLQQHEWICTLVTTDITSYRLLEFKIGVRPYSSMAFREFNCILKIFYVEVIYHKLRLGEDKFMTLEESVLR